MNLILSIDSEIEYRYRVLISFCYVSVLFFPLFFFFFHFRLLLHNRSIWQTFLIVFRRCSQLLFRVNTDINNLNFTRNCVYHQHATLPVFFYFFYFFLLFSFFHVCATVLNYKISFNFSSFHSRIYTIFPVI